MYWRKANHAPRFYPAAMAPFGEEVVEYTLGRARDQLFVLPHDGRREHGHRFTWTPNT